MLAVGPLWHIPDKSGDQDYAAAGGSVAGAAISSALFSLGHPQALFFSDLSSDCSHPTSPLLHHRPLHRIQPQSLHARRT